MSAHTTQRDSQPSRLLTFARVSLTLLIVSLLVMWLLNLPEYFRRITTLAVATYNRG